MSKIDVDLLGRHVDVLFPFTGLPDRLRIGWKSNRFAWPAGESSFNFRQENGDLKITNDRQDDVVGYKVPPVKIEQIGARDPLDGVGIAMRGPMQGMVLVDQFVEGPTGHDLGAVFRTCNFGERTLLFLIHKFLRKDRSHQQLSQKLKSKVRILVEYASGYDDALK